MRRDVKESTFKNGDSSPVICTLPKVSLAFDCFPIAFLSISTMAIAVLIPTTAFLPVFFSNLGDLTASSSC